MKEETHILLLVCHRVLKYAISTIERIIKGKIKFVDGKLKDA